MLSTSKAHAASNQDRSIFSLPVLCLTVTLAALAALGGCAGPREADPRPIAEDPVCLYNRDLGCVQVRVDDQTPRAEYQGKTYYFCDERCRLAFEKNPVKYAGR